MSYKHKDNWNTWKKNAATLILYLMSQRLKSYSVIKRHVPLCSSLGQSLEEIPDFEYLDLWVNSSETGIKVRKGLAWRALKL